jgi:hypothetical protein
MAIDPNQSTFSPTGNLGYATQVAQQQAPQKVSSGNDFLDLTSTLSKLNTISPAKAPSAASNIVSGINSFGSQLGFSSPVTYNQAFGPLTSDAMAAGPVQGVAADAGTATGLTSASLSSVLGAGALGYFGGGMLAKGLGLNPTGGSIGGALGASAGMAFGGAALSSLGLQLGSFAGPVGALAGGLLGTVAGGLFGGKPGTSADEFNGFISKGSFGNFDYGSKNPGSYAGSASSLQQDLSKRLAGASKDLGITFADTHIKGGVNTKHSPAGSPGYITVGSSNYGYNPDDPNSRTQAEYQALQQLANQSGYTDTQKLNDWFFQTGDYAPGNGSGLSKNIMIPDRKPGT